MAKFKLPADEKDWPGDSPERQAAALATAGALINPEDVISDYGDFNGDWGDSDHNTANGSSGRNNGAGPHLSTIEDVDRFYDSTRLQSIKIRIPPHASDD